MPEVTARTPIGAAIQAAERAIKETATTNRREDTQEVIAPKQEVTAPQDDQRLQALARREKALRQQQREFLMQKQQWEQERQKVSEPDQAATRERAKADLMDRIAQDPLAILSEFGSEIQALRESQTSAQKLLERQEQAAKEQAAKQISASIKMLVDGDPEFEAIKSMEAYDAVTELVQLSIEEGQELSQREAALQIEEYLVDQALKAAGIQKVKSKLIPKTEAQSEATEIPQSQKQATTLSNQMNASSKPTTAKDRRQRAIWAAQGLDPNTGKPIAG